MLADNVKQVEKHIAAACDEVHRPVNSVQVIAVTKTVSAAQASELVQLGITNIGENRVDKLLEKKQALKNEKQVKWHLIGNLQRKKVKLIINEIDYFHALDSQSLAEEIQKRAGRVIKCFVEVNVSKEESKHGIAVEQTEAFIKSLQVFPNIQVVGLMTMAPLKAEKTEILEYFQTLRQVQNQIAENKWKHAPCLELSMGMSRDYPLGVKSGATFVRIGTAFFQ